MLITKKQYTKDLDKIQYCYNYQNRKLEQDNRMLSARVSGVEKDLKTLMEFLKVKFITVPKEYKVITKEYKVIIEEDN